MEAAENIGKVLGGSYHLVRVIGEGGMGAVYEAEHIRLPRRFAVKLLRADVGADPVAIERFRREADIASSIGHEHIVDVVDFNVASSGVPYMVLELLEGEDLGTRIKRRTQLSPAELRPILEQVADALEAAHGRGVIHRDLKPQNIFLCRRGGRDDFVKILDFGISKIVHSPSVVTQAGTVFGTPNYMSPEQAQGPGVDLDPRTDVFTLGVVCYEALTGQLAFDGSSAAATLYKVCHTDPIAPRSLLPDIPPSIEAVVMRAMAKSVEDRWQTARQVAVAFGAALDGKPLPPELPLEGPLHVRPAVPDTIPPRRTTSPVTTQVHARRPWRGRVAGAVGVGVALSLGYLAYARLWPVAETRGLATEVASMAPGSAPVAGANPSPAPPAAGPPAVAAPPAPEVPAPAPVPVAAVPPPPRTGVEIRLSNLPDGARIEIDGKVVFDNPIALPFGPIARELRVTSQACAPYVRQVVPLQDAEVSLACDPLPPPRSRTRSRAAVDAQPPPASPATPEKKDLIEEDL
jgi:serine/threonine-protein kinase